jgi:hypothetical protein
MERPACQMKLIEPLANAAEQSTGGGTGFETDDQLEQQPSINDAQ